MSLSGRYILRDSHLYNLVKRSFHLRSCVPGSQAMSTHPVKFLQKAAGLRALGLFALCLSLIVGPATAAPHTGTPDSGIAGTWRGSLGSGATALHLVLTITKPSNGDYSG